MTVCIAVGVYDGLVFATDSAVTVMDDSKPDVVNNVYRHGHKLFNFHRRLPIVAMTSGLAAIDGIPMKSLAKDFRVLMERGDIVDVKKYTMEEVANAAKAFFFDKHYAKAASVCRTPCDSGSAGTRRHETSTSYFRSQCREKNVSLLKNPS